MAPISRGPMDVARVRKVYRMKVVQSARLAGSLRAAMRRALELYQ